MPLGQRFRYWVDAEIGSTAPPAVRRYLADHGYRLFSFVEDGGSCRCDVYHDERGLFSAEGGSDREALLGILRQTWLLTPLVTTEAG